MAAKMSSYRFQKCAKVAVAMYLREKGQPLIKGKDIEMVSHMWILGNNKGMFTGPNSDGYYFEVTYNVERNEFYVDAYKKESNQLFFPEQLDLPLEFED